MSETPSNPGASDPTQRFDATAPTPAASDPTASHSDADLTQKMNPPAYPGLPTGYAAPDPQPPAYGQQPQYGQQPPPGYGQPTSAPPGYTQPISGQPGYPVPAYAGGYQQAPPGYQQQYDPYGRPLSDKSKVVAGVLGIALGGFGAGRFYTGHTSIAIGQLVVTLVTCGLGHFWGLIDGIMILVNGGTDAEGRILRD
jgi:TM2 domain-containing membrane protein YozV